MDLRTTPHRNNRDETGRNSNDDQSSADPCPVLPPIDPGLIQPWTSDLSAWYVSKGLIVVALILALAAWSFRNALGGRKVLQGDFLEQ